MKITSMQNPGVKFARCLRDRKSRDTSGMALVEGYRAVRRALECGLDFTEAYYAPELFLGENNEALLEKLESAGAEMKEVAGHVLAKIAYRDRPEGIVGIVRKRQHSLQSMPARSGGLYVVAETLEKPGNLGSILRSADAAGADGVIVCDKRTDIYNPNAITASTGALFSMDIAECSAEEAHEWLKENKIKIFAATPEAKTPYYSVDLTCSTAFVVGAEQYGLSEFWKKNSDMNLSIPMKGYIDSLNVATASTVMLFEASRQRQSAPDR
ncbi:MAG: RNA methyltransferase [Victivallales bacterium]|nr:RNA methyltransferase [Victivallales bacterium]